MYSPTILTIIIFGGALVINELRKWRFDGEELDLLEYTRLYVSLERECEGILDHENWMYKQGQLNILKDILKNTGVMK